MHEMHFVTHLLDAAGRGDDRAREKLLDAVYAELRVMAAAALARESGMRTLQPTALVHEAYLRLFGSSAHTSTQLTCEDDSVTNRSAPTQLAAESGNSPQSATPAFDNRRHFFAAAAEAMRRILVDSARKRGRKKRGAGAKAVSLHAGPVMDQAASALADASGFDPDLLLDVDAALDDLAARHPREADVVKLRYFAGLSVEDTAAILGIATRTVEKDWSFARACLKRALDGANNE